LLVDNAASASHVRPLLPAGPGTFTVVTSRDRLGGLVATHGATRLTLGPMPLADAVVLLGRVLPGGLTPATMATAERLAQVCDRLPLALRIAASRLDAAADAESLVRELTDERRRLDILAVDGDELSVRAALAGTTRSLSAATRRVFRLLALHPGPRPSVAAAAALAGRTLPVTTAHLDRLCAAHLLSRVGTDHYQLHDLVRIYAAERVPAKDRAGALTRLLTWYRDTADAADGVLRPGQRRNFAAGAGPTPFADEAAALAWLDAEAANLLAAVHGVAAELPQLAWQTAAAMFGWLTRREHRATWVALYRVAVAAAARAGDLAGQGLLTSRLVIPYSLLGRSAEAIAAAHRAYQIRRDLDDPLGAATALLNLGAAGIEGGQPERAIVWLSEASGLGAGLPDARHFNTLLHSNLGEAYHAIGRHDEAMAHLVRALDAARDCGAAGSDVAQILAVTGSVHLATGDPDAAVRCGERALAMAGSSGDRSVAAMTHEVLGRAHLHTGASARATAHLELALAGYEEIGQGHAERVRAQLRRLRSVQAR
jgi:tetratricopeptide (TPR) repeat protein